MTPDTILLFLLASAIATISPGPDNLSVISYSMSQGRRAGMLFGFGCAAGCLLHTFWLCIGLSALIAASAVAFTVLKIAGALYFFYLAFQAFRNHGPLKLPVGETGGGVPGRVYFRRGFVANAINPKVAIFFLAFLPGFTQHGSWPIAAQFAVLGCIFALQTIVIFGALGSGADAVGAYLQRHTRIGARLDHIAGAVFAGLGVWLLFTQFKRPS